ncbi:MAG TPA: hypothetical protein VGO45_12690, partial [Bacteroidia bacterium]|nr:hypothetical protein [Bacteroidia bacterium]
MKQIILFFVSLFSSFLAFSQDTPSPEYNLEVGDIAKWPASMVKIKANGEDTTVSINYFTIYIQTDMKF